MARPLALVLVLVLCRASALLAGDTVLLDFTATWCGPCRVAAPTVARLESEGYPVQKIDIDQRPDLARHYGVTGVPCFVMLSGGREVDRVVGPATYERLRRMFERAAPAPRPSGGGVPFPAAEAAGPLVGGTLAAPAAPPRWDEESAFPPAGSAERFAAPGSAAAPAADVHPIGWSQEPARTWPQGPAASSHAGPAGSFAAPAGREVDLTSRGAAAVERALAATVRLKIEDAGGHSYGTGTIIDAREGKALVLTCGHIFRESQGRGRISVDLFVPGAGGPVAGQVIDFDLKGDVALVVIAPPAPVTAVAIVPPGHAVRPGDRVFSIGCDRGGEPLVLHSRVTSLDKFVGPPNVQVAGQPVLGRSGGGLFAADGRLIGVCNAADPEDDEGLYAAAAVAHQMLDKSGLSFVYQASADAIQLVADQRAVPRGSREGVPHGERMAGGDFLPGSSRPLDAHDPSPLGDGAQRMSQSEWNMLEAIRRQAAEAEIVCILRSPADPRGKSRVVVIEQPSAALMNQLADEFQRQQELVRRTTSLNEPLPRVQRPAAPLHWRQP